eukprot:gene52452-61558_t
MAGSTLADDDLFWDLRRPAPRCTVDENAEDEERLRQARARVRARREFCRELPDTPREPVADPAAAVGAAPPTSLLLLSELVDDADEFVQCIDTARVSVAHFNPEHGADSFRWLLAADLRVVIPGDGDAAASPRAAAAAFAERNPALGRLAARRELC